LRSASSVSRSWGRCLSSFAFSVGIDLNPGPRNGYVLHGDFHNIIFADASIDAVYTNALDHSFDLQELRDLRALRTSAWRQAVFRKENLTGDFPKAE
jgi:hypothetical protein